MALSSSLHLNLKNLRFFFFFKGTTSEDTENSSEREKRFNWRLPHFPRVKTRGRRDGGRKEEGVMWHCSPGVATVQKEADLQRRWPLTSKAAERVLGGPSTTQSITSQSLLVSRTVRGHRSLDEWTNPQTFLSWKLLFFGQGWRGGFSKKNPWSSLSKLNLMSGIWSSALKLSTVKKTLYAHKARSANNGWIPTTRSSGCIFALYWFSLKKRQNIVKSIKLFAFSHFHTISSPLGSESCWISCLFGWKKKH